MPMRTLGALAVVGALAAACGGAGTDAYVAQLEAAVVSYDDTTAAASDAYRANFDAALAYFEERTADADTPVLVEEMRVLLDRTVTEVVAAFTTAGAQMGELIEAMSGLDPPADFAAAHGEMLDALMRARDAIPELLDAFAGAEALRDIGAAINGPGYGDTQPRVVAACRALEAVIGGAGTEVDLRCGVPLSGR
jgi:enamine deaminase RidA (YjgF/YER057c/UK114 family)